VSPAGSRRPRRPRWWIVAIALGVVVLLALALGSRAALDRLAAQQRRLDPSSTLSQGTSALRELLSEENIDVARTTRLSATLRGLGRSPGTATLVVVDAGRLSTEQFDRLLAARPAQIVLLAPTPRDLAVAVPGAHAATLRAAAPLQPGCSDRRARSAGAIQLSAGELVYSADHAETTCYASGQGAALVSTTVDDIPVILLAQAAENGVIAEAGNAALAMNVLGAQPRLVWLMATAEAEPTSGGGATAGATGLLPAWWPMLLLQVFIGLVVVALWRGRRFGPIITERLPVRIKASETVEGHGRLYHQRQARGAAAAALRRGTIARLNARFGAANDPQALALLVAARTGRAVPDVARVLTGPTPTTDDELRDLKITLDELEQEARTS